MEHLLVLRLHESNTSHAWPIYESNPEQLLVFKAPRVGSTSRVNKSGEQVGSTIWGIIVVYWTSTFGHFGHFWALL